MIRYYWYTDLTEHDLQIVMIEHERYEDGSGFCFDYIIHGGDCPYSRQEFLRNNRILGRVKPFKGG